MLNMVRKSIAVLLISLIIAAGSISASAAEIAEGDGLRYSEYIRPMLWERADITRSGCTLLAFGKASGDAGIDIDGSYMDWTYYPHSAIQHDEYAEYVKGALYNNGNGYVYGHTVTLMPAHQNKELGGMRQFYISVNGTNHADLNAVLISAGYDGRLHFSTAADYAANMNDIGNAHKYYIVDAGYIGLKENMAIDELAAEGQLFGVAYVTKFPSQWDMEYMVNVEMLAKKAGLNGASDVKTISAQFRQLGSQWVTTAGASTGGALGVLLCIAAVPGIYHLTKKKLLVKNK